jgi:hypothetical protein
MKLTRCSFRSSLRGCLNAGYWRAIFRRPLSEMWHKPIASDDSVAKDSVATK